MVLITGASKGIGLKVAEKYTASGETVIATDKEINKSNINCDSNRIHWLKMDVTDREEVKRVIDKVESEIGEIDILVSVAGVFKSCLAENTTIEEWNRIFQVNTTGVFNVTQTVAERMKSRKKGSIVVVSSNASKFPRVGMAAYAASKAAVSMYAKCLALELSEYGIRCNIVSPGSTNTDMQRQYWNGAKSVPDSVLKGDLKTYRLGIPLNKIAEPDEIADAIFFLASDKAGHITMEEVTVDGGATMGV